MKNNYYGSFQEYNDIIQQQYRNKSKEFIKAINSKKRKVKRGKHK